jgi:hypothetical protein
LETLYLQQVVYAAVVYAAVPDDVVWCGVTAADVAIWGQLQAAYACTAAGWQLPSHSFCFCQATYQYLYVIYVPAACPLWKKVRQSPSAAHLARWYDHMSSLPACAAAVEDLCPTKKREAAAAADTAAGKGGGGARGVRVLGFRELLAGRAISLMCKIYPAGKKTWLSVALFHVHETMKYTVFQCERVTH